MTDYKELWIEKRQLIKNLHAFNTDWEFIINNIFQERIREYYLNPINKLITKWEGKGEWFSIVAIECLLIETFSAFRYWMCFDQEKAKCTTCNTNTYYYSWSKEIFVKFLKDKEISIFEKNFWTSDWDQPIWDARKFYSEVRCWLLHEAQTKWKWTINTIKWAKLRENFLWKKDWNEDWKIQIYRTTLASKLSEYLKYYCTELAQENQKWEKLRKNLWRKFDHMFEILEPETNWFDWWNQP